jgi:hypothetical protein
MVARKRKSAKSRSTKKLTVHKKTLKDLSSPKRVQAGRRPRLTESCFVSGCCT